MKTPGISELVERVADRDMDISPRESLTRIFIRPWLFLVCLILPPLIAVGITSLVPVTYKASVKILIRYGESEAAFLRDLVPENRAALSGLASAEILRSLPSVIETVQSQGITEADIARSPKDIVVSRFSALLRKSSAPAPAPDDVPTVPGVDRATLKLAEEFKNSLADSTSSSAKPIQLLEKGVGSLPTAQRGDDMITMTVPSFNRLKVAAMANGLAESFKGEYARLSADEAHRSVVFLDTLIAEAETAGVAPVNIAGKPSGGGDRSGNDAYRRSPLLDSIARELATREAELASVGAINLPGSPAVANARAAVQALRASLNSTERQEVQKLAIEHLKLRRYQAANTEALFRGGLAPISIVEPAIRPDPISSASRYLVSGGVGLALGLMLALGAVVVLSVTDQRLHTTWDVERLVDAPLLATLPLTGKAEGGVNDLFARFDSPRLEDALLQLLGRLDLARSGARGLALAVTSASDGEGKTFVVSGLAAMLARGGRHKVLIVDADLRNRSLSLATRLDDAEGFIDAMLDAKPLAEQARPTTAAGVHIVPAGRADRRNTLGFYRQSFERALADARQAYDFVLVDTTAVLNGNEPMMCGTGVDGLLWVASAGTSRRPLVRAALGKLRELGLRPLGVVLNRRRQHVPSFVWRNV